MQEYEMKQRVSLDFYQSMDREDQVKFQQQMLEQFAHELAKKFLEEYMRKNQCLRQERDEYRRELIFTAKVKLGAESGFKPTYDPSKSKFAGDYNTYQMPKYESKIDYDQLCGMYDQMDNDLLDEMKRQIMQAKIYSPNG